MFLRRFLDGRIFPLSMSSAGDPPAGGGGTPPAGTAPPAGATAPISYTFSSDKPFSEQLPERYRADPNFRDIKNLDGVFDSYVNAQKLLGADKNTLVQLPKDGDDKALGDFYNKLGRPESADKYAIGKRADGGDYSESDKAFQSKILPVLHEAGLTQKQFDKIRPAWDAMAAEAAGAGTKAAETYATEQQAGLKKEWGAAYDDNMKDAQAAVQHLGNDALVKELNIVKDGKATGDSAELLKVFAKLGKQFREDGVLKGGTTPPGGAMAPAEAQAAIAKLQGNPEFVKAYRNKDAVGKVDGADMTHADAVKKMAALYEFAYPGEPPA